MDSTSQTINIHSQLLQQTRITQSKPQSVQQKLCQLHQQLISTSRMSQGPILQSLDFGGDFTFPPVSHKTSTLLNCRTNIQTQAPITGHPYSNQSVSLMFKDCNTMKTPLMLRWPTRVSHIGHDDEIPWQDIRIFYKYVVMQLHCTQCHSNYNTTTQEETKSQSLSTHNQQFCFNMCKPCSNNHIRRLDEKLDALWQVWQ